ncbi:hypothetical protein BGX29_000390, partial [Mortierella sp. GBA35]
DDDSERLTTHNPDQIDERDKSGDTLNHHADGCDITGTAQKRRLSFEGSRDTNKRLYSEGIDDNPSLTYLSPKDTPITPVLDAETELQKWRALRISEHCQSLYIPPRANVNLQAKDEESFPLMDTVKEFLRSDKQVFLPVTNPFLLILSLRALPNLAVDALDLATMKVPRLQLYDKFIDQWLELNKRRLRFAKLNTEASMALEQLIEGGFTEVAIEFAQDLAAAIFRRQDGNPIVQYIQRNDRTLGNPSSLDPNRREHF